MEPALLNFLFWSVIESSLFLLFGYFLFDKEIRKGRTAEDIWRQKRSRELKAIITLLFIIAWSLAGYVWLLR